ncbi:DNA-directed RNA polymeras-like protein III 25 kDa polypeptide [Clohesyomyces aquaticus]|uniref:DNA-directed RNA polymerase subunit n=1 Tax=Clohesyomyces aquaticus TaxID=1231657 RepID=A0A1Y1ZW94_9PLEO|nr:DNA-directed RNA polymeras-like protein III 25 kDa polypeptide [Clohesyomyces aquaticus]
MFILTTIEDLVQLKPSVLNQNPEKTVKDAINEKYSNKIIYNVGLCICMWDLLGASDGMIGHGTGLVNVNVEFRLLVFRPFRGEILSGKIKHSDSEGITMDLSFTSEIIIPASNLFPNSTFSLAEGVWVWRTDDGTELFLDKGEPALFRVESEIWEDQQPGVVRRGEDGKVVFERGSAWRVVGSMALPGLGPTLWWAEQDEEEGEGEDQGLLEGEGEDEEMIED